MSNVTVMHRICVPVHFPHGVSVGADRIGNGATISRDGVGRPLVRGSSWAGVLRRELHRRDPSLVKWFDDSRSDQCGRPSNCHITVHDSVLYGASDRLASSVIRTHNAVDRHDGAPVAGALFTVEAAVPGASCTLELWIAATLGDDQAVQALANEIATVFRRGIMVGGSKARGLGECRLSDSTAVVWQRFDLSDPSTLAQWLDLRSGRSHEGGEQRQLGTSRSSANAPDKDLDMTVEFVIPAGQDLLCGDGQVGDRALDVQRVVDAAGNELFRLPGSSLRGVMRGWCSRLAAREGKKVAYSHDIACEERWTGADAADVSPDECEITNLFGSAQQAGRIHISDALVPVSGSTHSERTHVSIDRAWATSREGMLFSNGVLTKLAQPFKVRIRVKDVAEHEATWIARTLLAIHIGLVRIGSSKAAGRLEVKQLHVVATRCTTALQAGLGLIADRLKLEEQP